MDNDLGLSPQLLAQSGAASERIRVEIGKNGGVISFARYMELALYDPAVGYYCQDHAIFGAAGDFITAPELSPLFAECLARQIGEVFEQVGGARVLEFGAGSGAFAADLLAALARCAGLPETYHIVEPSGELRARQQRRLATRAGEHAARVVWSAQIPEDFTGVVIANEVLDAMPVTCFRYGPRGAAERCVTWETGGFRWTERPAGPALENAVAAIDAVSPLPDGYCSEVNLQLAPWLRQIAQKLRRGALFFIDYGYPRREYYHPERAAGTLICHYRHRAHADPFVLIGLQDITAFVDFTAVAAAGMAAGLELYGYAPQSHFLLGCGLDEILLDIYRRKPDQYLPYAQQAKSLTLPGEMGEKFKIIALGKGLSRTLRGFSILDHQDRL